jgi:hypothetical protein
MSMKNEKVEQNSQEPDIGSVKRAQRWLFKGGKCEQIMNLNVPGTKRISAQEFRDMRRAVRLRGLRAEADENG